MNKAPQPTGPPPARSPGLPQPTFPPGQTAPMEFSKPQATQMNMSSQPRQHFYPSRAHAASRVQSAAPARPGPAAHVYPAGSQVMMIPSQISYSASQGAYYIPGQGRSTYVVPTQQYPVKPGAPGFYPGASPTEFGTYAGAYYPAQGVQQFPASVAPAPVLMNRPAQIAPKRERKTIRIRDPNQGGKDITEEIMSGARTASTPTPPQTGGGLEPQPNGETPQVAVIVRPENRSQGAAIGGRPGLSGPEHSPSESQPSSPSPTPSPPPILEPGSEPNLGVLSIPGDTITTGMMQMSVEESTPISHETGEPYCLSPEPTLAEPLLEVEVTLSKPIPESEFSSSPLQVPTSLASHKVEIQEPNGMVPSEDLEAEVKSSTEPVPPPLSACASESPLAIAPTAQPEELLNGAPSPPVMDLSPVSEPEEQAAGSIASVAPPTILSDSPPMAPSDTSLAQEEEIEEEEEESETEKGVEDLPADSTSVSTQLSQNLEVAVATQVAISVPKRSRKIKKLNKKEAVGDLLDAFKEVNSTVPEVDNQPQPPLMGINPGPESEGSRVPPQPEEADETWDSKEDKIHNVENIQPGEQKYENKSDQWKPLNLEEKKRYHREFLLGFQFIFASMQKPEGLPHITDVVLDKANKTPLRPLDPSRLPGINCGPDFILCQPWPTSPQQPWAPKEWARWRTEPQKIIATVLMTEDIKLNKAEKAWKPSSKRTAADKDRGEEDADGSKTQDLFCRVRSILNKLTPQMFQQLMKQVTQLAIDTEERLKGVIDLIFEKAISEPNFSLWPMPTCAAASWCLKCPLQKSQRKLLLNRCQKEFEKDKDDDEFIGELFKLKMLTEAIMHDCVFKLLKNHDEESLECLCRLLTTIGKDLDFAKAKPQMDQYFNQMEKIIKEKKTSSQIRFMLQDVLDLRQSNWVPRRGDQGPKTIDQIHKEAEMEEHREHIKVQQLMAKGSDKRWGGPPGPLIRRGLPLVDDGGWNTVPISKGSRPRSFSKEVEERGRERPSQPEGLCKAASLTEDRGRDPVKREATLPPVSPPKAALSEDEVEKKSKAIEAVQCVQELASPSLLFIFSTLEHSIIAHEHMGQLLHQLLCVGLLPTVQYYQGLYETLELAEDMEIDIPHVWLYLAELITPVLQEDGVPMGDLFREITKPLRPMGKAASLLLEILGLLCKSMSPQKVGMLWREAGLSWKEFLTEGQDIGSFVAEQKVEYTLEEGSEVPGQRALAFEDLRRQLEKLLKEGNSNQRVFDWIEANLNEQQIASNTLVRALMTTVCYSAIIFETPLRMDVAVLKARERLLKKYLCDEQKELQALYALQALVVTLEQPANLLWMFFDALYDEDMVKEDPFYSWESNKDPAEQQGKGVALKSVNWI
uniref:Eukaryotic translation initiation factor 4 gamma 1 n=1 Tax=Nannospalax galili TaxID=1026970 RepID=A0A8C6R261_NANGA